LRFGDSSGGLFVALRQYLGQRIVYQEALGSQQDDEQNSGRHSGEQ
jgi:hypothetical protein